MSQNRKKSGLFIFFSPYFVAPFICDLSLMWRFFVTLLSYDACVWYLGLTFHSYDVLKWRLIVIWDSCDAFCNVWLLWRLCVTFESVTHSRRLWDGWWTTSQILIERVSQKQTTFFMTNLVMWRKFVTKLMIYDETWRYMTQGCDMVHVNNFRFHKKNFIQIHDIWDAIWKLEQNIILIEIFYIQKQSQENFLFNFVLKQSIDKKLPNQ